MAVTVTSIVDKLLADLVDLNETTWSRADVVACINEAARALCEVRATAYTRRESVDLVAGEEQALPTGGLVVIDVTRNSGSGAPVTLVDRDELHEATRFADVTASADEVIHWMSDPRDVRRFAVWPRNSGSGAVMVTFGAYPDLIVEADNLPFSDEHEPAIVAYSLAAAYRRNTQRQDMTKSQHYTSQFMQLTGAAAQSQVSTAAKGPQ